MKLLILLSLIVFFSILSVEAFEKRLYTLLNDRAKLDEIMLEQLKADVVIYCRDNLERNTYCYPENGKIKIALDVQGKTAFFTRKELVAKLQSEKKKDFLVIKDGRRLKDNLNSGNFQDTVKAFTPVFKATGFKRVLIIAELNGGLFVLIDSK